MELRPGYKQTQVGVIPEEWEVDMIGDAFDISGGISASRDQLSANGYCYLHYGDIHKSAQSFINVRLEYLDLPKLDVPLSQVPSRSLLSDGDVVFVDASEDDLGTSKHLVVINPEAIPYISGLHTIVAKSKTPSFENTYKRYCFQTQDLRRQFYYYAAGTKVSGISKTNVKKIFILRPPFPEQRAIAAALSDVDALIDTLDRLIAKKRDLKHAAVQQLLTGQTRLPGFSGKWEVKRLGEVGTTYGGLTGKIKADFGGGSSQYIPFLNVIGNTVIDPSNLEQVRISPSETQNQAKKDDLFFNGSSETPEEVGMCAVLLADFHKVYLNSFCFGFRVREGVEANGLFLAYFFRSRVGRKLLYFLAQGATRYNLSKTNFLKLEVPLPTHDEQTAIAAVLSDMDAEIAALETRRDKTRALKQGMMQELLTGRIRLM